LSEAEEEGHSVLRSSSNEARILPFTFSWESATVLTPRLIEPW
jgi:hypothetical protein